MKFSTVTPATPATLATLATQRNALFFKNSGKPPATLATPATQKGLPFSKIDDTPPATSATFATQKGTHKTRVAEVAGVAAHLQEKLRTQAVGVAEVAEVAEVVTPPTENLKLQEVHTGQGGPELPNSSPPRDQKTKSYNSLRVVGNQVDLRLSR